MDDFNVEKELDELRRKFHDLVCEVNGLHQKIDNHEAVMKIYKTEIRGWRKSADYWHNACVQQSLEAVK